MAEKKAPTAKFIVTQPNTLNHKVGDEITLTAAKAKALVGKVRLAKDVAGDNAKADEIVALKKENAELAKELADLKKAK